MKPFKPPTIVKQPSGNSQTSRYPELPPLKKRRISHEADDGQIKVVAAAANILKGPLLPRKFQPPARRKPLEPVENGVLSYPFHENGVEGYYRVVW
jgi:hypothetical protein